MARDRFMFNVTYGKFDFPYSYLLYKITVTLSVKLKWERNACHVTKKPVIRRTKCKACWTVKHFIRVLRLDTVYFVILFQVDLQARGFCSL